MPLTAEDVKNKQFTPTRFKGGYDEKEVDDFLDEVEAELTRLYRENTDLRARLQVAEQGQGVRQPGAAPGAGAPAPSFTIPPAAAPEPAPAAPQAAAPPPPQAAPPPVPLPAAVDSGAASQEAAMRMLAMAQKTAEDTVSDAKRDADRVLSEARAKAEQLERESQERHRNALGSLDGERERLERKIEELRSFEREYRARLKSYLEGQLRDLDGRAEGVQPTAPRPVAAAVPVGVGAPSGGGLNSGASSSAGFVVPPAAQPPHPPSPFSPAPTSPGSPGSTGSPAPGSAYLPPTPGSAPSTGPSGPPRQPSGGGFEVDEGPEVPPSHG
jgi:DivIVA domain-containing protein